MQDLNASKQILVKSIKKNGTDIMLIQTSWLNLYKLLKLLQ